MLWRKKNIRVYPHQIVILDLSVKGLLVFAPAYVGAKAHVPDIVDVAGLPAADNGPYSVAQTEGDKIRPAFQEWTGEIITRQAEDNNHRDSRGLKRFLVTARQVWDSQFAEYSIKEDCFIPTPHCEGAERIALPICKACRPIVGGQAQVNGTIFAKEGQEVFQSGRLNKAVKRTIRRFPEDFMFQLTQEEFKNLISQFAISSFHGGRRKLPQVFTEQGVAMLSAVLNSEIAIDVNLNIMRAFVQLRRIGLTVVDLKRKIDCMESKYDRQFKIVFDAIRQLLTPPPEKKKKIKIGFAPPDKE